MNTISKQPPSTRQFFLVTVALSVGSFIPLIGWLSGAFLLIWLAAWILTDIRGFLSITWRTILSAVLLYSCAIVIEEILTNPHINVYDNQFLIGGTIGFSLSAFGLVRSILKARKATS